MTEGLAYKFIVLPSPENWARVLRVLSSVQVSAMAYYYKLADGPCMQMNGDDFDTFHDATYNHCVETPLLSSFSP